MRKTYGEWTITDSKSLGIGGNSTVWKVINNSGQIGAIKLPKKNVIQNQRMLERFRHEIEIMNRLRGARGILPILDSSFPNVIDKTNIPWLVTPLATPLNHYSQADKSIDSSICILRELATSLALLHRKNIAHRDIKPGNIFLYNDEWCLGDFGLVDFPDKTELTVEGKKLGPIHYIAPEMLNSPMTADGIKADVYSFGKLIWVLCSGQNFPIPGEHILDSQYALAIINPDRRAPLLDGLIRGCTRIDPKNRITIDQALNELELWTENKPTQKKTPISFDHVMLRTKALTAKTDSKERRSKTILDDREAATSKFLSNFYPVMLEIEAAINEDNFCESKTYKASGGNARFIREIRKDMQDLGSSDGSYCFETRLELIIRTEHLFSSLHIGANICVPAFDENKNEVPHDNKPAWGAGGLFVGITSRSGRNNVLVNKLIWGDSNQFLLNSTSEEKTINIISDGIRAHLQEGIDTWIEITEETNLKLDS